MILALLLVLWLAVIAVVIPIVVFMLECAAAALPPRHRPGPHNQRPTTVVLIPAHNEEPNIAATIASIRPQLHDGDRILVVADNCSDSTAAAAHRTGAIVIERNDPDHVGKGYALDYAIRFLQTAPPQIVVMIDADCHVYPGAIAALTHQATTTGRPAQAVYLMEPPPHPTPRDLVSTFAFLVKNHVRPLGCWRLRWPCPLMGAGMAFPWRLICEAPLASSNIVEDMQLGIDMALAGIPPELCHAAKVTSRLPSQASVACSQRKRWEHGHLQTIGRNIPQLLLAFVRHRRFDLLGLAMDLAIPPLALLTTCWIALTATATGCWYMGKGSLPMVLVLLAGGLVLAVSVLIAWARFGRSVVPASCLLLVPLYILWKAPLYASFVVRRQTVWVRTARL